MEFTALQKTGRKLPRRRKDKYKFVIFLQPRGAPLPCILFGNIGFLLPLSLTQISSELILLVLIILVYLNHFFTMT